MARVKFLCLVPFLLAVWTCQAQAQTETNNSQQEDETRLSPGAVQVARKIGVAPLLRLLGDKGAAGSPMSLESLAVRQDVTERVLGASLDIDTVNAVIDLEIEQIRSIRSDLQSKRDRAQNIINVASLVTGSALGVVDTALQFKSSTANLGNGMGVGGGASSVVLSIVGIHKQGGGRRSLGDSPRMLAKFFGRPLDQPEVIRSDYPEEVWSYLNSATPSQPEMGTRREQLIAKWRREGRIEQDASPKGERRIEFLSSNISHVRRLSIDELSDRVAMLLDVRATLSLMKRDLREILLGLSAGHGNR